MEKMRLMKRKSLKDQMKNFHRVENVSILFVVLMNKRTWKRNILSLKKMWLLRLLSFYKRIQNIKGGYNPKITESLK